MKGRSYGRMYAGRRMKRAFIGIAYWNIKNQSNANYTITATATDLAGNTLYSGLCRMKPTEGCTGPPA